MGKRKAASKQPTKKKSEPLATTFKCLFCNHEKVVSVKLDKQTMFGKLDCKNCRQYFQTPINNLSAAVDVYYDWVDACEEARARQPPKQRPIRGPGPTEVGPVSMDFESRRRLAANKDAEDEDEDAEGDEDEEDDVDDRPVSKNNAAPARRAPADYDDDDEDDVDDVDDERGDKRRRADLDSEDDSD
ncbi:transcription elongation factor Elf1 like-domain-containing protein [Kockovaella imperatae]|uniref:Transcription elongation factor 1 homolog n=1 Tax=Kockovaella imperatae TaxID=4999 RepID=A0A1Y1U5W7_9TREE|nr:transcription elongation factor Elf1 like-domain-containing protein [Kockovaella imperatae]ORX33431.1 transcription elongation factor Elf1 like-domain-containing protein [Kockovaella imperatae]